MVKGSKKEPCDFNTTLMYEEALSFEETANRLGDWQVEGRQPDGLLAIPWMVNKAFAIELYLKILLVIEEKYEPVKRGGHYLYGLYNELNEDTKNAFHHHCIFYESLLKEFSDAFVACRYFYEYNGFIGDGIPTFIELSNALRIVVKEKLER